MALPPLNLVPVSELDSVNNLLLSIGQSPVNTLSVPGVKDVSIAQMILHDTSREVQSKGWSYNVDTAYPMPRDVNGTIPIPANALQVVPDDGNYVERARKLYDTGKRTFAVGADAKVTAEVTWFFAYEDLPQIARKYIERRAGRLFQAQIVGSQILHQYNLQMESEAAAEHDRYQLRSRTTNFFSSPAAINRIYNRR
ncbi:hypothetical protein [Stenotrophomonas maltophilia]|uniref:hypothetical protein n=1 Tax=Stenotrophomonas maltophilia TaxID=40324 RepID=UPI002090D270|nr:hypothetical protein [Stenotrophomonas maltophilia]MCO5735926.1 hypothetical protein [Stenotrophomonas maltophilia]